VGLQSCTCQCSDMCSLWFATLPKAGLTRRVGVGSFVAQSHGAYKPGVEMKMVRQRFLSLVSRTAIQRRSTVKSHSETWLNKRRGCHRQGSCEDFGKVQMYIRAENGRDGEYQITAHPFQVIRASFQSLKIAKYSSGTFGIFRSHRVILHDDINQQLPQCPPTHYTTRPQQAAHQHHQLHIPHLHHMRPQTQLLSSQRLRW
jgi:hypothetical protein